MREHRQGLLGGSFDPVHLAHIELARQAQRHLALDSVTLIPAARPWQRGALGATAQHRLEMLKLATAGEAGLKLSTVEIDRDGPTYTIDTLRDLPEGPRYFWILGADQLENFCSWKQWQEITTRVELAVAARPGSALKAPPALDEWLASQGRVLHFIPMPPFNLSATEIRQRIAGGQSVDGMMLPSVAQYIQQHGLYRHSAA